MDNPTHVHAHVHDPSCSCGAPVVCTRQMGQRGGSSHSPEKMAAVRANIKRSKGRPPSYKCPSPSCDATGRDIARWFPVIKGVASKTLKLRCKKCGAQWRRPPARTYRAQASRAQTRKKGR